MCIAVTCHALGIRRLMQKFICSACRSALYPTGRAKSGRLFARRSAYTSATESIRFISPQEGSTKTNAGAKSTRSQSDRRSGGLTSSSWQARRSGEDGRPREPKRDHDLGGAQPDSWRRQGKHDRGLRRDREPRSRSTEGVGRETKYGARPQTTADKLTIAGALQAEYSEKDRLIARKELQHLEDPVKLNKRVRIYLMDDKFAAALRLVRLAGPRARSVVAWNGIIKYLVERRDFGSAVKVFNDMKKRGHSPDAFTYSQLFQGLACPPVTKRQVELAKTLYTSLSADNSKVAVNSYVTTTAIKVAINGGDYDWMWELASDFQDTGPRAPDVFAFDAIFYGMRKNMEAWPVSEPEREAKAGSIEQDATKIWEDLVRRDRQGYLKIDNRVVTTFMRLLLERGGRESALKVLKLAEVHLHIPMQDPEGIRADGRPNSAQRPRSDVKERNKTTELSLTERSVAIHLIAEAYSHLLPDLPTEVRSMRSYWNFLTHSGARDVDDSAYASLLRSCSLVADSAWAHEIVRKAVPELSSRAAASAQQPVPYISDSDLAQAFRACAKAIEQSLAGRNDDATGSAADHEGHREETGGADTASGVALDTSGLPQAQNDADGMFTWLTSPGKGVSPIIDGITLHPGPVTITKYLNTAMTTQRSRVILATMARVRPIVDRLASEAQERLKQSPLTLPKLGPGHINKTDTKWDSTSRAHSTAHLLHLVQSITRSLLALAQDPSLVGTTAEEVAKVKESLKMLREWIRNIDGHITELDKLVYGQAASKDDKIEAETADRSKTHKTSKQPWIDMLGAEYGKLSRWRGSLGQQEGASRRVLGKDAVKTHEAEMHT